MSISLYITQSLLSFSEFEYFLVADTAYYYCTLYFYLLYWYFNWYDIYVWILPNIEQIYELLLYRQDLKEINDLWIFIFYANNVLATRY